MRTNTIDKQAQQRDALRNAVTNASTMNYDAIFAGFMERGIAEDDILPRENVFTFKAWKALGRTVRKGEHGVRVVTFVACKAKKAQGEESTPEGDGAGYKRAITTYVFHITQTEPLNADTQH